MRASETKNLFNPRVSFFSLPIVYWTIGTGLALIILISLVIITFDPRELDISASGFNELLSIFKIPIAILGFFAALLALFATNHRSEQNKEAMELTASQNRFSNYYKHIEEYKDYITDHFGNKSDTDAPGELKNTTVKIRRLHKALYPNAKTEGIKFFDSLEIDIFQVVFKFIYGVSTTNFSDRDSIIKLLHTVDDCITVASNLLQNSISFSNYSAVEINFTIHQRKLLIPDSLLKPYLESISEKLSIINEILYFEENFNSALFESLLHHVNLTISYTPDIILDGKGVIEWHLSSNETEGHFKEIHESAKELTNILQSVKINFPKYNIAT